VAGLNDDAQWIIMMGFIVSFSLFFLALVINQSTVVGQSTAEGVIEFPKNDIRDIDSEITGYNGMGGPNNSVVFLDFEKISLERKNAIINYTTLTSVNHTFTNIHYNNGVTVFNENWSSL
jgi:hypothetical protein